MHVFTLVFVTALSVTLGFKLWLARRHLGHVRAHREQVPEEFAARIPLASHQKAADYTVAKTRLATLDTIADAMLLLLLTLGGGLAIIDATSQSLLGTGLMRGLGLLAGVALVTGCVNLPFAIYRTFVIEARFGFNKITPALFIADLVKQTLLGAVIGLPLALAVLWMMEQLGPLWWLYAWLTWIAFNVLMLAVFPVWIAPLLNHFTPLNDQALRQRIEGLVAKCGFRAKGLFVMDGSKRSGHGNAYFTGLGQSKRIVFFDTLLERLNGAEIEAVLAHELGHFKRHHITKRIAVSFALSFVFLALLGWIMDKPWFYSGLNAGEQSTGMALVLFFLVMPVFLFVLQPLSSFYSRQHEFEADAYAAQQTGAADLISALVKLYQDNAATLTPDPLHSVVYDSHPPAALRIAHLQGAALSR